MRRSPLLVTTRTPVIVHLKDYGLQDGGDALRTVVNLNLLSSSAPVSFSVLLRESSVDESLCPPVRYLVFKRHVNALRAPWYGFKEWNMLKTLTCAVAFALPVMAFSEIPKMSNGMMVDNDGMTLYTFDKDTTPGQSGCTGGCTTMWPAATAGANDKPAGDWSFVPSADGKNQWAYKGHPLYRYAKDTNPGDMKGDGFKGMWHVVKP